MTRESEQSRLRHTVKLMLPKEHGSWSLALEPLVLGLLAAPTAAGGALALAALAGFFLRRPLKLVLNPGPDPRRRIALGSVIVLGLLALFGLSLAARFGDAAGLWPLMPAALAGIAFAWFDSRNTARESAAELAGATAFGILPAAFGALAGWSVVESMALAAVMLSRSIPTVLFVRTYLRHHKGRPVTPAPALIAAGAGLFLTAWLVFLGTAPWPAAIFAFLLAARTLWLLGGKRRLRLACVLLPKSPCGNLKLIGGTPLPLSAKTLGMVEMTLGAAMVLTVAVTWKCF